MFVNSAVSAVRRMGPVVKSVAQKLSNQAGSEKGKGTAPTLGNIGMGMVMMTPVALSFNEHVIKGKPVDRIDAIIASLG
jgi:hypothetical protein